MREKHIDFLRQIALFYMFFQHSVLGLLKPGGNSGIVFFLFELVPVCPALFLFLSGYSLAFSSGRNKLQKKYFIYGGIKKSFLLFISGELLFIFEHGFQLPDCIISPNILFTIGLLMLTGLLFLFIKHNIIILSVFILLSTTATLFLEYKKIFILPFNNGYEPWSPTIIFGYIGLLAGLIKNILSKKNKYEKPFYAVAGITGILLLIPFIFKNGIFYTLANETGRVAISRVFKQSLNLLSLSGNKHSFYFISIWNFSYSTFFVSLAFVLIFYSAGSFMKNILNKHLPENIFAPGKTAFINYFFHLGVIGLCMLIFGSNTFNTFSFLIFLIVLFALSYLLSFIFLIYKRKLPGHLSGK